MNKLLPAMLIPTDPRVVASAKPAFLMSRRRLLKGAASLGLLPLFGTAFPGGRRLLSRNRWVLRPEDLELR